jgi:esterase/lipase superfamily enzyme
MDTGQTSEALVAAIAQIWPELPRLIEGDWGEFQSTVLARLAALDDAELAVAAAAGDDRKKSATLAAVETAQNDLLGLFGTHPAAFDRFSPRFDETLRTRGERGSELPPAGSILNNTDVPFFTIPVFYATDRKWADAPKWYTGERSGSEDLSYGVISISLPVDRKIGILPDRMARSFRPWFGKMKRAEFNPQKYCEIMTVDPATLSSFAENARSILRARRGSADSGEPAETSGSGAAEAHDVLVFIHGYNVSFDVSAKRAAQLAYDLDFTGVIVLYSWPSRGAGKDYVADGTSAEWSTPHLVYFLQQVLPELGARHTHLVAHSMGNQILVRALDRLGTHGSQLGHVVFAAPDVDEGVFGQLANGFGRHAVSYTVYVSSNDLALRASEFLSRYPRMGQRARSLGDVARIEIIDASRLPKTDLLGHSGFAEDRTMLNDMKDIFVYGRTADQRSAIEPRFDPQKRRYWAFRA